MLKTLAGEGFPILAMTTQGYGTARRITGPISLEEIQADRARLPASVVRTPLVGLNVEDSLVDIFLKLENLQPTGSFKVRGASNSIALAGPEARARGVYTVSAGNMAQALAWQARERGIERTTIVPDNAPTTKLDAIKGFDANVIQVSFDQVWQVVVNHQYL